MALGQLQFVVSHADAYDTMSNQWDGNHVSSLKDVLMNDGWQYLYVWHASSSLLDVSIVNH